ncbi:MAG: hypothetical protein ABI282_07440 [Candidatus Baltobacteraceae bacterium]
MNHMAPAVSSARSTAKPVARKPGVVPAVKILYLRAEDVAEAASRRAGTGVESPGELAHPDVPSSATIAQAKRCRTL